MKREHSSTMRQVHQLPGDRLNTFIYYRKACLDPALSRHNTEGASAGEAGRPTLGKIHNGRLCVYCICQPAHAQRLSDYAWNQE